MKLKASVSFMFRPEFVWTRRSWPNRTPIRSASSPEDSVQMLWWWPLVIVMGITGNLWLLRARAASSAAP